MSEQGCTCDAAAKLAELREVMNKEMEFHKLVRKYTDTQDEYPNIAVLRVLAVLGARARR